MTSKILFLGSGSEKDPGFNDVLIEGIPYREFMRNRGVTVADRVVESCHGCYDLMTKYSEQMQHLTEQGNRVVAVLQGGLLFGLPSIQATQTTFPIISHPLDMVAYSAFMVPPGHAAITSVGVDVEKSITERTKALSLAERILNLENPKVNVFSPKNYEGKLKEKLESLGVYSNGSEDSRKIGLCLIYGINAEIELPQGSFVIMTDSDENLKDWAYLREVESKHHSNRYNGLAVGQVRGLDNLAMMAAKIISLQKPDIREIIKQVGERKRSTYPSRDLINELNGELQ